jgi:hypothetical protein
MSIGDVSSDAKGSAARYNDGKPDYSLIPLCTLEDEVRVWMHGARKYAAFNWMKGMPWSAPLACALRHLSRFQAGEDIDAESGLPHLAHAMCNLRMLTLYAKTYPEGDDRPKRWLGAKDPVPAVIPHNIAAAIMRDGPEVPGLPVTQDEE